MELKVFKEKIVSLWKKSGMHSPLDMVFDEDRKGTLYIDAAGNFYFADALTKEWVLSPLNIKSLSTLRYSIYSADGELDFFEFWEAQKYYMLDNIEKHIILTFESGDCISFYEDSDGVGMINAHLYLTVSNKVQLNELKERCNRQYFLYVDLQER